MFIDPSGESLAVTLAIIFGVAGAIEGGTYLGIKAYNAGIEGWGLAGKIALGAIVGGIIGASMGFIVGTAIPGIGAFLGTTIPLFNTVTAAGELVAVSVTGAQLVAAGSAIASLGGLILYSKNPNNNINLQGTPNSSVSKGGSTGYYDSNGNLIKRIDTDHKHFIKELGSYYQPHTHYFKWYKHKGIWRFIEKILPV